MDKYSKNKLVAKRYLVAVMVLLIIILICLGIYIYRLLTTKVVKYGLIDRSASSVKDEEAINSTPIIINNIIIGGVYNSKWVDSLKYVELSKFKEQTEVDIINQRGKAGTYYINKIEKRKNKYDTVYVDIIKNDYISEYYGVAKDKSSVNIANVINMSEEEEKEHIKIVKNALLKFTKMNNSVKINEAYGVSLSANQQYTLLFVSNSDSPNKGVYSAIIAVDMMGKAKVIKYNYYKDVSDAAEFEVYSFKFVGDLNSDGISEIVVQATREFTTSYYVIELKDNEFYEILSSTIVTN